MDKWWCSVVSRLRNVTFCFLWKGGAEREREKEKERKHQNKKQNYTAANNSAGEDSLLSVRPFLPPPSISSECVRFLSVVAGAVSVGVGGWVG